MENQNENLKCCGNCKYFVDEICNETEYLKSIKSGSVCSNWAFDDIDYDTRRNKKSDFCKKYGLR